MYPFIIEYELPPMQGTLSVIENAKDEHEARYIACSLLIPVAKIKSVRRG
ncbi:hypothetical protein ACUN13_29565 [Bacillus cereus group sp. Bce041]